MTRRVVATRRVYGLRMLAELCRSVDPIWKSIVWPSPTFSGPDVANPCPPIGVPMIVIDWPTVIM